MSLRPVLGLTGLTILLGALALWHPVSPRQHLNGPAQFKTYTVNGARLASFYDGAPVATNFSHGRNPFTSIAVQVCNKSRSPNGFTLWFKTLVGDTTVHAQNGGCGTLPDSYPCGQGCGSPTQYTGIRGGQACNYGTQSAGSACDSACNITAYSWYVGCVCGGGGGGGGGDDCGDEVCEF